MYQNLWKRLFDILFSLIALLAFSPVLIILALAIKLDSSGPLLFIQARLGRNGHIFHILKFRTMFDVPRIVGREIFTGDAALTRIGCFLRRAKLDELPQFLNILWGDMSVVGPRPCVPQHQEDFNADGWARRKVRPGLTGLAQILGNTYLSWPERWLYDRQYVESVSFVLDLKILFTTVAIVLFGEDKFIKKPHA